MEMPDLVGAIRHEIRSNICRMPCYTNRASAIGDDCERKLVYMRTSWQIAAMPDVDKESVFREGRLQERAVLRDLQDAEVEVIEQQTSLTADDDFPDLMITGHVDGVIPVDGVAVPLEIKSMAPHIWQSIAFRGPGRYEWEEVRGAFAKKPWLRKYLAQLTIYMRIKRAPSGILLCKNKSNGALAQIDVGYDEEYLLWLYARAERVNGHVSAGTYPDRISWDPDVCGKCEYLHLCCPDRVDQDPMAFLEDEEVRDLLSVRRTLRVARMAYERAHKRIQAWAKANGWTRAAVGTDWTVEKVPHGRGTKLRITYLGEEESDGEGDE